MLMTRKQLRKHLKKILKESSGLNMTLSGRLIQSILSNNSITPGFHDKVAFIPFSPTSAKFLSLMEKRNGTEFGNVLEPIIADIMVSDGYAGTTDLNISAGGGETVLADIMTPANPPATAVTNPNPDEVEINDVFISAKASKDFFDLTGANYMGKLPKLIDQSYTGPQKAIIDNANTKIIKCKLGAAFAGAYYQPSMASGEGLIDSFGNKTIVPIAVKLFFPNNHNLAICKNFSQIIPSTPTNLTIAKDTIYNYVLTRQTGASSNKISQKSNSDVKLLQAVIGRCNVTDINSIKRLFIFKWNDVKATRRPTAYQRFEHESNDPKWNPMSVKKTSNPLASLFKPTDFVAKNFPTVLGNLNTADNPGSDSILIKPDGSFVDILDDTMPATGTGPSNMETILLSLKNKAKQNTAQIIDNYFTTNQARISQIGIQTNQASTQHLDLNLQYYNALKTKLNYLGQNTGGPLVPNVDPNGVTTGIKDWAVFVNNLKQALINLSNVFYDSISLNQLKTALTNTMKEYNKTYIIGTPTGEIKQNYPGYAGATPMTGKLSVKKVGTPESFSLSSSNPGIYHPKKDEEKSDLRVWTISSSGYIDDVTDESPSNASAFAEKIYASNADYTTKNYLILFQAGIKSPRSPGDAGAAAYATKILNNLASGAMTKNPRPQGNVSSPQPDPVSQASASDIQNLKNASELLINTAQTASDNTAEGFLVASGQYAGLVKTKSEARIRYSQIIAQLATLDAQSLHSAELIEELFQMKDLGLLGESISLSIKSLRHLIESELRRVETIQMIDKKKVIFATNYYNELSSLIRISIDNPSDINYQNVIKKAQLIINAAENVFPQTFNLKDLTGGDEVETTDRIETTGNVISFPPPVLKSQGLKGPVAAEALIYEKILKEILKHTK